MFIKPMNKRGVTLIELVVVFVIIAIGAALLVPNIGSWLPNYRLRSATRDIVSTMRTAQMKAVSTNTQYDFNVGGNNYVLRYQTTAGFVNEGVTQSLPTGVTFIGAVFSGGVSWAVFNTDSRSSAGTVTLQNTKGTQRNITLTSATGRVRID
jgi:prepilin-type N-terminal cleavage/methylation domain-containing protein